MESEFWKSSLTIDNTTLYLVKASKDKAVYRIDNSGYRCYAYDEVIGVITVHKDVTWEQASEFLK